MRKICSAHSMLATLALAWSCAATASATAIDFLISHDGSSQQRLQVAYPTQVASPYALDPVTSGPLAGYFASIEPGWDGLKVDDPANGRFGLASLVGAAIRRISFDPGFEMFDSALNPILSNDGDTHTFSGDNENNPLLWWHEHLRYGIAPGAQPGQTFRATFQVFDVNGVHADSLPFTLEFQAVPEPSSALLLVSAGLLAAMLRRRA